MKNKQNDTSQRDIWYSTDTRKHDENEKGNITTVR